MAVTVDSWEVRGHIVSVGDKVRVLNSRRSRAFNATVVEGDDSFITVENHDKGDTRQTFLAESGEPSGEWVNVAGGKPPLLCAMSDPQGIQVAEYAAVARPRARVNEIVSALSRMTKEDSTEDASDEQIEALFDDLEDAVEDWRIEELG